MLTSLNSIPHTYFRTNFSPLSDRHQLVQQIQMIGGGAHGQQAAQAIRHVAAKNGVWSLGNFGGVPPKSAMGYFEPGNNGESTETQPPLDPIQQTKLEEHEYRSVFNNCAVGMVWGSRVFRLLLSC